MKALEFETKISNGIIRIPEKYKQWANALVRIILLKETDVVEKETKKENLKMLFKKIQQKNIFKKINDPIQWQKELRNEWR